MKRIPSLSKLRVAISLEMEWAYKRHLQIYAGSQHYPDEAGWLCSVHHAIERMLSIGADGRPNYDGIIARATPSLATAAKKVGIPLVNVWLNSPVRDLPSVFSDFEISGAMAAEHLIGRTIADEITRLRLERAIRRMVETDAPMKDVAIYAGFRNTNHFYKVITRIETIPPSQYREERQQAFPQKV